MVDLLRYLAVSTQPLYITPFQYSAVCIEGNSQASLGILSVREKLILSMSVI